MSKKVKELYVDTICSRLEGLQECVVVGLSGIDAQEDEALRRDLRDKNVQVVVVKNRLAAVALERLGVGPVSQLLDGPSAVAWGGDTIIELSKAIQKWADQLEPVVVRGGYSDGAVLSAADVEALSKMPSREELLGRVAGQLTASAARVVSLATGPASRIRGQIKELSGGGDDGGEESAAA